MTAPAPALHRSPVRTLVMALAVVAFEASLLALALGGFGALLLHRRAVALVLVWAAGAAVLGVLRPVRAQDPAERAPRRGLLLVALLVIPLVTPMLCAWAERAGLAPLPGGAALRWSGVALAAAGLALRIAAMVRLGDRFAPVVALQREHALETRGPYATLRHPGYVGSWLANLGATLAFGSAAGLVSPVLFAVALEARMREEEAQLERRFGDAWRAYAARAGRWAPHA